LMCNWQLIPEVFCAMNPINFRGDIVQKREVYERQKGICLVCTEHFEI